MENPPSGVSYTTRRIVVLFQIGPCAGAETMPRNYPQRSFFFRVFQFGFRLAALVALTVLRIDWAKHPEKYADAVEEQKKDQEKKAAQQRHKEMEQERQRDWKGAQSAIKKGGKHK